MTMPEEKHLGFKWGNVYIAICLFFGIVSTLAIFHSMGPFQRNRNPITLMLISTMYFATAFGTWKRRPWGLYLTGFTLLLFFTKGISDILIGTPEGRAHAGIIIVGFSLLYGIYFFRRRNYFEW